MGHPWMASRSPHHRRQHQQASSPPKQSSTQPPDLGDSGTTARAPPRLTLRATRGAGEQSFAILARWRIPTTSGVSKTASTRGTPGALQTRASPRTSPACPCTAASTATTSPRPTCEEAIYQAGDDPLVNWDASDLVKWGEAAGFAVTSNVEAESSEIQVTPGVRGKGGFEILRTDFLFFFPRWLGWLRRIEPRLTGLPLGAQYLVLTRKR